MREFRNGKNCTEHYSSLDELGAAWGCAPVEKKRTKDKEKLKIQREKFLGVCPVCQSSNKFVSPQYVVCSNVDCKGKNIAAKGEEPRYVLSMRELDAKGKIIASQLFD
jgi:hypothetical protein